MASLINFYWKLAFKFIAFEADEYCHLIYRNTFYIIYILTAFIFIYGLSDS